MGLMPRGLHSHTTLESTDVEKALRFYREVLGLSTAQQLDKVGLLNATNGHIAAIIQMPKNSPQPYWNYYARAVPRERVDELHAAVARVAAEYEIAELREPERESRFGIGTYGFALRDRDGNWWRIEEQDGPFGRAEIPDLDGTSVVPPGPIAYVTLESRDLDHTALFYREFLGLNVERKGGAIHSAEPDGVNIVTVPCDGELLPQPVLNHHGLTLEEHDQAGVDRAHALVKEQRERWRLGKIQQITNQHGSYQFYFQDCDTNWWEVETLWGGFNPWQRISHEPGSEHLLHPQRGRNTILRPYREPVAT